MGINEDMLTLNQERYVQELVKGKSQRQAYREAYPKSQKYRDAIVDSKASILFKMGKVKERYEELLAEISKPQIDEAEKMRQFIIEQYQKIASGEICDETTDYDAEGNVVRVKKTVKVADKHNALIKLAELYGVQTEKQEDIHIILDKAGEYDE